MWAIPRIEDVGNEKITNTESTRLAGSLEGAQHTDFDTSPSSVQALPALPVSLSMALLMVSLLGLSWALIWGGTGTGGQGNPPISGIGRAHAKGDLTAVWGPEAAPPHEASLRRAKNTQPLLSRVAATSEDNLGEGAS